MRPSDGHLDVLEGALLLFAVLSAMLYLQYPVYLVEEGGPAAWEVALIITPISLVMFWPLARLTARFPGRGLAAIGDEVVSPWLSRLFTLTVSVWLLSAAALTVRNFTETFKSTLLPATPPSVLMVVILLVVLYTASRGLEPLGRVAQLLFPLIFAGGLLILVADLPQGDISFLFPILGHSPVSTLWGGVVYTGLTGEVILLLVAGSNFRSPRALGRAGFWALLLFGVISVLTEIVLVMVFGAPDAARMPMPLYSLARVVHLGRFFQRLEAIAVMFWFFTACTRLAALVWGSAVSLAETLGLPYYRPLLGPTGVLVMALAFMSKDYVTVLRVERDLLRPLGWVMFAIPVVLWLVALARGKGGESNAC